MKTCPRCQKTYADDNLNFCLEDGSVLTQSIAAPPPTVQMNQPPVTAPQPQMPSQPGSQPGWNVPPQQAYSMQPAKKSSKIWVWVLLILGGVVLLCGGGFVGLVWYGSTLEKNSNVATSDSKTTTSNTSKSSNSSKGTNNSTSNSSTTTPASSRTDLETVDLEPWVKEFSAFGNTEFTGGEFIMSSKKKGFYYVLAAPEDYKTEKADTRVTLRNVDNAAGSLGYGLIFHSNPTPLQQDYAFLIDTKKKKYRIVNHTPQNEKSVVSWTTSTAIKEGSEENTLEVRDLDDKIELYINGTMVTSIKNLYGYSGGVAGLYAGDGVKVAFKNLEIRK
jgi:hypothetical protein